MRVGLRVGLVILPEHRWVEAAPRWRAAEEYGFDHVWTYDHLGWRSLVDGPWFDAVATLTAAATVTGRIRLGTFVASPNFRHPGGQRNERECKRRCSGPPAPDRGCSYGSGR